MDELELFAASVEEIWSVRPWQWGPEVEQIHGRCSDIVAGPPLTTDGHLWVAHDKRPLAGGGGEYRRDRMARPGRARRAEPWHRAVDQRRLE